VDSNDELIDYLVAKDYIESEEIEEAFREVDRADFIDTEPYVDRPVRLAEDSTVSAPHMVAMMLELLEPRGKVLEMGSGSGYMLALLLQLSDQVTAVERIESLVEKSGRRVPEAEVVLGHEVPDKEFDRLLFSFATTQGEVKEAIDSTGAEIAVAPVEEDGRQILKKFTSDGITKKGYVRFSPRKDGVRTE
jgi:protein-L-isoaspartate(D-aspartate) O-methyltransferase